MEPKLFWCLIWISSFHNLILFPSPVLKLKTCAGAVRSVYFLPTWPAATKFFKVESCFLFRLFPILNFKNVLQTIFRPQYNRVKIWHITISDLTSILCDLWFAFTFFTSLSGIYRDFFAINSLAKFLVWRLMKDILF